MQIKRKLQINSVGIVLLALSIVLVLSVTAAQVNRAMTASNIATAIFVSSYERLLLRTDSHRTGSERTRIQLTAKHKEIGELLQAALKRFPAAEDRRTIRELLNRHDSIGYLLKTIGDRRAQKSSQALGDPLFQETEDLLVSQLNTNVYESILLQGKLLESSDRAVDRALRMAGGSIFLVLLLVSSVVLVNSVRINRIFAARLDALRKGTTLIGGGNLDHRIEVRGDDEFGELAGSFNEMASKLSRSYRDLEGEVEERRRAEEALRRSETRLRRFYDSGLSGVVYWNMCGEILDANDKFLEMTGYSREDLRTGRIDWVRMTPPEYRRLDEASARELQATGVNKEPFEKEYLRKDGSRVPVLVAGAVLEGSSDVVAFVLDITARKQAEASLRDSEKKFALAFANNPAAIVLSRLEDGVILEVNETWLDLCGYRREEIVGRSGTEMWPGAQEAGRFLRELKEKGALRGWEQTFRRESGELFVVQLSAQLMAVGGEPVVLTTLVDITERKRAEERVRESEERLRLLGDNLPDSAVYQYVHEPGGGVRFLYFSAGVERLNGVSVEEVLRDAGTLHRQVLPEYHQRLAEAEAKSARELCDFDMELPMRRSDGRLRWMQLHSRPRALPDGTVLWDGVQTDITHRVEAEEKIAHRNAIVRGINRIFEAALSSDDDGSFGEICLAVAEEITGSRFGFIGEIGEDGHLHDIALSNPGWELCSVYDTSGERRLPGNFHIHGIYGAVIRRGKGLFSNDPASHPDAVGVPEGHPPLRSFLGVPILSAGKVSGMIAVGNREGGYRQEDLESLEAVAPAISEAFQRREAESALREREESFRMLVENNPAIIGRYDRQHRYLYLSPSAETLTGQSPEAFLGKSPREMGLSPELCDRWEAAQNRAFAGERVTIRTEIADAAGRRRVLLETFVPERGSDGSVQTILAIAQDITELIEAQEEKEVLLKEIHHRVKNNLQVISSLVSLQAGGAAEEVREILNDVSSRVRSMALVHEKLYGSADLAHIDFADYLESLLAYIWRAHGSVAAAVRLDLDLEPVSLPVDTAVPCGLIMNELAGNALKHAFRGRERGVVAVSLRKGSDGAIRLRLADDGVGLPDGLDWRKASSLGLRLVQMLAGQLGAEVEVDAGQGTAFELIIGRHA